MPEPKLWTLTTTSGATEAGNPGEYLAGYLQGDECELNPGRVHLVPVRVSGLANVRVGGYPPDTPVELCWHRDDGSRS